MFNRIALALYVELKKINPCRLASWIKRPDCWANKSLAGPLERGNKYFADRLI